MSLADKLEKFGLEIGQKRKDAIVKGAIWCNAKGEKFGWGDLEGEDLFRISREIGNQELFLVMKRDFCKLEKKLSQDIHQRSQLLAENCLFVVSEKIIFLVEDSDGLKTYFKMKDVWFSSMTRSRMEEFLELILVSSQDQLKG